MKTFAKSMIIFLLFMIGTMAFAHVDRQCAAIEGKRGCLMDKLQNFVEKQSDLL